MAVGETILYSKPDVIKTPALFITLVIVTVALLVGQVSAELPMVIAAGGFKAEITIGGEDVTEQFFASVTVTV
ncbi:hypothetical protein D3C85_850530 [compost metagenome]